MNNVDLFRRRILGLTSYFRSASESLLPRFVNPEMNPIKVEMSDYQIGIYENARKVEREQERKNAKNKKQSSNKEGDIHKQINSTYRIFSRLFCNFVYPEGIERPLKSDDKAVDVEGKEEDEITEDDIDIVNPQELIEAADTGKDADDVEKIRTKATSDKNKRYYSSLMRSFNLLEANKEKYFNKESLQIYSPKFLTMLENIEDEEHKGIHLFILNLELLKVLVYSNY